jgi:predicted nucleic acid-binding Zn ribbon protein
MRRRAPRPLAVAVGDLREQLAPRTPLARVQAAWSTSVGEAVAREARPVRERDGVIEIACRSSVWAQELELMGPHLTARLNAALGGGAVRSVRCVVAR